MQEVFVYLNFSSLSGPEEHESLRVQLTTSLEDFNRVGYLTELRKHVLKPEHWAFDTETGVLWLHPDAVETARELAKEYVYTVIG